MVNKKILLVGLEIVFADKLAAALREKGAEVEMDMGAGNLAVGGGYDLLLIHVAADLALIGRLKSANVNMGAIILAEADSLPPPVEIIRLGGDDYFIQSCDLKHLLFRIDRCLQYSAVQQKLLARNGQLQREITARKDAGEEWRRHLQFYKTLINAINQPLYVVDVQDYTIKLANDACLFHGDYEGKTCHELTHGADSPCCSPEHSCPISEIRQTGKPVTINHVHTDERGEDKIVEVHAFPIFDDNGELRQIVEHSIDVTERLQLQKQLRHAQKMESIATMAAGISHDFNNILTVILGFTDLADSLLEDDNEIKPYLDEVIKAGRRARDLIAQILSFSREAELDKRSVLLNPMVKETIKLLKASLPATIELRFDIDPECGRVMAEPTQIHQVLMNICSNAFQAMEASGGVLEIKMTGVVLAEDEVAGLAAGKYLLLRVSDTGVGMDPVTMDRIFEPYFSTKAQGQGSGLGLSVAHGIITAHDGGITVSSEQGEGTVFSIYLPEIDAGQEPQPGAGDALRRGNGERIIFVDDEESIAGLGERILRKLGYKVTVFMDSRQALAAIRQAPDDFDLLLSDFTMPGLTGISLTRELRRAGIKLPVIIISGYSLTSEVLAETEELGISAVLKKPFEYEALANALAEALKTD